MAFSAYSSDDRWPIASPVAPHHFISNWGQTGHIADIAETS